MIGFGDYDGSGMVVDLSQRQSAVVAKYRLRNIIPLDREACPAWRWVQVRVRCIARWNGPSAIELLQRLRKPAFRWERRQ